MTLKRALLSYGFAGTSAELDLLAQWLCDMDFFSINDMKGAAGIERLDGFDQLEVRSFGNSFLGTISISVGLRAVLAHKSCSASQQG